MIVDLLTRGIGAAFVGAVVVALMAREVVCQLRPAANRGWVRLGHPIGLAVLGLFVVVVVVRFVTLS